LTAHDAEDIRLLGHVPGPGQPETTRISRAACGYSMVAARNASTMPLLISAAASATSGTFTQGLTAMPIAFSPSARTPIAAGGSPSTREFALTTSAIVASA